MLGAGRERRWRWFLIQDCESFFFFSVLRRSRRLPFSSGGDEAGGRGQQGCGLTPPWVPTCPCLRRRPESEVLVDCSVASVSEASLAFCCVERLEMEKHTKKQSQRQKFQPKLPTRGSRMNEVDFKPHPARLSGLQSYWPFLQVLYESFQQSDYNQTNQCLFERKEVGPMTRVQQIFCSFL